jgi:hypothetical protein
MGDKNKKTGGGSTHDWSHLPVVKSSDIENSSKSSRWSHLPVVKSEEVEQLQQPIEEESVEVEQVTPPTEEPTITIEQQQYLRPPVPVLKTEPEFFNPDVTQMKPIGVVQQPPKKLPYSERLEKRTPRTREQIVQEQNNAFDILAKDYAEDGMTLPGFMPPSKTQFIDPVHPINKLTSPTGSPEYTAQYRNTKIGKLRDQLKNAAIYESGSEIELRPVIEKKIQEINSAAEKVIDLQLFNREYQQKKFTPEQAQYELATIQGRLKAEEEQYKKNVDAVFKKYPQVSRNQDNLIDTRAADEASKLQVQFNDTKKRYEQQQQQIISNSKYNMSMLGAEKEALFGNKQAQQDLANLKAGRPINPELKYKYDQIGRDIINEGLESTVNENVKKEATPYADVEGKQIKAQNKEFIKLKAKEDIGNRKYRDETTGNAILNAIVPSALRPDITPEQITKYAKDIGVDDDVTEELIKEKDSIPKEISVWQSYAKGYANVLAPALYERAVRSVAFAQGKNVDEMFPPGWEDQRGIIAKIAGNMPTEQNSIHNIRGVAAAMANTIGMLQSFGIFAKMGAGPISRLGVAPATSEKLANFGIMAFEGYNGAYQQAKDIVGDKPEDEWRRQLYSMASGGISGLIFSTHPQSKYAINLSGEAKKTAEQFLNEIKNTGMKNILTPKVTSKFANHIIEMGKMEGLVISQATANKLAQNQLYNIAKPGTDEDLAATEGLGEDVMHTALTFLIPSIMSGYGAARQRTPLNKAAIFDVGTHAKEYVDWVYKQKSEGKMTNAQASQLVSDIGKIKAAQEDTPPVNDEGDLLTPDQIKDYTFSLLQQRALQGRLDQLSNQAKARSVPVDKSQEAPIKKQIAELIAENDAILKSAGIPEVRPTQEPPIVPENKDEMLPVEEVVVEPENKPEENLVVSEEKDITLQPTTVTEKTETSQKPNENEQISNEGDERRQVSPNDSESTEVGTRSEMDADTEAKDGKEREVLIPSKETEEPQRAPVNGEPAEVVSENKPRKPRRMFVEEEVVTSTPEQPVVEVKPEEDAPAPTPKAPAEEVAPEQKPITEKELQSLQAKLDAELAKDEPKTTAAQKAKKKRIENLQKQIKDASARLKEQQQKGDTESSIQKPEGVEQAGGEAKTPSPESGDSVQRGEGEKEGRVINKISPEQKRKDGKFEEGGVLYERNPEQETPVGDKGTVQFSQGVDQEFEYMLVEADDLQSSHINGNRNPKFFIPEAQPKERTDDASIAASDRIAANPEMGKVGESPNAYSGAPVVNARGEVIQGNNRAEGLKKHYKSNGKEYKAQLAKIAAKFGLTTEQVEKMNNPVLVRRVKVSDENAIRLGNYDAKDIETGGKRRIDPVATSRRIPDADKAVISEIVFSGAENETLNQAVRNSFNRLFDVVRKYLSPAQVDSLINKSGDPKKEAIEDIESLVGQFMFDGGHTNLPDFYDGLKQKIKDALRKSLPKIFSVTESKSLLPEIQNAMIAHELFKESGVAMETWLSQRDMFNEGKTPKDIFSPLELKILDLFINAPGRSSEHSKDIVKVFQKYASIVNGSPADMFSEGVKPKSKAEAVKEIFNIDNYESTIEREKAEPANESPDGGGGPDKKEGIAEAQTPAPEKAIETKYEKVASKIEDSLEAYLKRSKEVSKGMMQGGLTGGFSTRVGDNIIKAIAKATIALVRAGKNVHVAIYRAIEQVKSNDPEGAKGLKYEDIDTLNKILSIVPERPKSLPELSKTNREIADEWVEEIRKGGKEGGLTYGQAVVEVMQAEGLTDATREKVLNYMNFRLYKEAAHKIPHPEPKEGNMVAEMSIDESKASQFLGEKTTEDIYGEEGVADEMGEDKVALRLESIMESARNTASAYKEKFGGLATKWGAKMFSDIKDVPNDPKRQATALVGLQAELQSERIRNEMDLKRLSSELANNPTPENRQKILEAIEATTAEQQRLRALTAQVQNYWKKLASTSSDVLNIRRGDRMMRDAMMGDYYSERILTERQVREMREVEKALTADIMKDYKNHPQYKAEMSIKREKARSQARARREKKKQEQAESKEGVVSKAKEKVKDAVEAVTGNRKKEAEKRKEAARNDFPLNDKGERMTPKEFLEFIKKLKKPC